MQTRQNRIFRSGHIDHEMNACRTMQIANAGPLIKIDVHVYLQSSFYRTENCINQHEKIG